MIQSGTTTYADMYYFEEEIARATQGGRPARRARADDHPVPGAPTRRRRPTALARAEAFIKEFKDDALITPAVAPHALYTLDARDAEGRRALAPTATACR